MLGSLGRLPLPNVKGAGIMTQHGGDVIERVSAYVEAHPGCDAEEVRLAVPTIRGATSAALRRLERTGFIERRQGRYRTFKAYRRAS